MLNNIDSFKVFYICNKLNLCLVLQEDYSQKNYIEKNTNHSEVFSKILKETEFTKLKVVNGSLHLVFQSFKRNCTILNIEENNPFKLYMINHNWGFHVNISIERQRNLEFGKNNNGDSGFLFIKPINSYYKNKLENILKKHTKIVSNYTNIKEIFFSKNEVYSFEPVVLFSKKNKITHKFDFAKESKERVS